MKKNLKVKKRRENSGIRGSKSRAQRTDSNNPSERNGKSHLQKGVVGLREEKKESCRGRNGQRCPHNGLQFRRDIDDEGRRGKEGSIEEG